MPNQINYPDKLNGTYFQRPDRLTHTDIDVIRIGEKQVLFGVSARDIVEIWVYDANGAIVGHTNVDPTDPGLSLVTLIDQTGPQEVLNIDFEEVVNRMDIAPGRYATVLNILRDEVGSELGYKLYISDISDDRTEVQLSPVEITPQSHADIHEFATPSVPRVFASALIDQVFAHTVASPTNESLSFAGIELALDAARRDTIAKVMYAQQKPSLETIYTKIVTRAYPLALDNLAKDTLNLYVQRPELEIYIMQAVTSVITAMVQAGEIDPHFELI